jgi:hypothetical protein
LPATWYEGLRQQYRPAVLNSCRSTTQKWSSGAAPHADSFPFRQLAQSVPEGISCCDRDAECERPHSYGASEATTVSSSECSSRSRRVGMRCGAGSRTCEATSSACRVFASRGQRCGGGAPASALLIQNPAHHPLRRPAPTRAATRPPSSPPKHPRHFLLASP